MGVGAGGSCGGPWSPWRGLGRRHLAGLCLGDGGGGLVVTQWVLATAEGGEHAVPELEGRGRVRVRGGQGPPESGWEMALSARCASSLFLPLALPASTPWSDGSLQELSKPPQPHPEVLGPNPKGLCH